MLIVLVIVVVAILAWGGYRWRERLRLERRRAARRDRLAEEERIWNETIGKK